MKNPINRGIRQSDRFIDLSSRYSKSGNSGDLKPVFSFEFLSDKEEYGLSSKGITKEEKAWLLNAIFKRSQCTWNSLDKAPKDTIGYEKLKKSQIRGCPNCDSLKYYDDFLVFRVKQGKGKKSRMICYREGRILYIVMYDRKGIAYDHGS